MAAENMTGHDHSSLRSVVFYSEAVVPSGIRMFLLLVPTFEQIAVPQRFFGSHILFVLLKSY